MRHLGDITKIDWASVEPVDVVTGGSPCQDLSVAGKRAGLAGERSGLYMEQIRCVKELRQADVLRGRTGQFIRPRFMVWENVPGAFSSGAPKGSDFAAVVEELIKIAEPDARVCIVPPSNGWTRSGCYYAEDGRWSIAWRVHDAQFWGATYYDDAGVPIKLGTPQRRKRIALVADFGGLAAPEVLFERKGLSGNFESCGAQGEGTAEAAETSIAIPIHDKATRFSGGGPTRNGDGAGNGLGVGNNGDPCPTLSCGDHHMVCAGFNYLQGSKAMGIAYEEEMGPSIRAGQFGAAVFDARGNGGVKSAPPLQATTKTE